MQIDPIPESLPLSVQITICELQSYLTSPTSFMTFFSKPEHFPSLPQPGTNTWIGVSSCSINHMWIIPHWQSYLTSSTSFTTFHAVIYEFNNKAYHKPSNSPQAVTQPDSVHSITMGCLLSRSLPCASRPKSVLDDVDGPAIPFQAPSTRSRQHIWNENNYLESRQDPPLTTDNPPPGNQPPQASKPTDTEPEYPILRTSQAALGGMNAWARRTLYTFKGCVCVAATTLGIVT